MWKIKKQTKKPHKSNFLYYKNNGNHKTGRGKRVGQYLRNLDHMKCQG